MRLKSRLPILGALETYTRSIFKQDLIAGLTVGVMLVPQGMAYAMLAGLPPIYGLYASVVPLLVYAVLGTSRQLAVGPVAMVSLLVAAGVGELASVGSEAYIGYALLLALMVGVIQFAMGLFRLGFLVNFLSHPVVSGFTSAAALIIGFSQLKHLLGIDLARSNFIFEVISAAAERISETHLPTLLIGAVSIGLLFLIKKKKWSIPGPLVVVTLGISLAWGLQLADAGVKIVGKVPGGLPAFNLPAFDWAAIQVLLPIALTISFIGFMESIAVAKAIQKKHKNYKLEANQELIALGAANMLGSLFQAFPVTGGFSRTAVNDQAGAKTTLATILSALLVVLTLLFLTPLFFFLPKAILAAIIMVAVVGLIDWQEALHLWKVDRTDFWMMLATFAGTLFIGIEQGVLTGALLSMGLLIFRTARPHIAVLGKIPGHPHYRNVIRFEEVEQRPDILIFRFDARLYYVNLNYFRSNLDALMDDKGDALRLVIFDASSVNGVDSSAVTELLNLLEDFKKQNISLYLVGLKGPIRDQLQKSGFTKNLGEDHFFLRIQHAVDFYDKKSGTKLQREYVLQADDL
ncbi:MAG: solute carrier family 26 protein [Saprospiraceae bacterium]|nr:solute carrier family 26 protein [Saprospiraceae bacterium]